MTFNVREIVTFNFPTSIHFGAGARKRLGAHLRSKGFSRPLIVTDRGLVQSSVPAEIRKELSDLTATVFSEIFGNPTKSQVSAGVAAYRSHRADCIVALGGGAPVDVAKAIALMVNHPGDLFDYEDGKDDARGMDQPIPYLVAVPTTAGTGSEVGRSTVISDDQTKIKKIIFSPRLLPQGVFADPELTLDLPAKITAATGMDALTHLVEAYLAKGFHPICDGIALEGLRLVRQSLRECVKNGKNLEARGLLLVASMMGAMAFQKGLGVTHSCAHALSTVCDLHHGLANGIMIPYALEMNVTPCRDRFEQMAKIVQTPPGTAESFLPWLVELKEEIGIPKSLSEVGVKREHLGKLLEIAVNDACHPSNPVPVTRQDFERIFLKAFGS